MTHDFAKRPKKNNHKTRSQVPGWVWLFTGIVTGLFIAFLAYLADITPPAMPVAEKQAATQPKTATSNKPVTNFEFYTLLPEREVIVATQQESADNATSQQVIYILQAGSFKSAVDADRLRAKLLLLGMDTNVIEVTGKDKDIWHRVQVGPFVSRSKLSKTRNTLIDNNIETLLLKRKLED